MTFDDDKTKCKVEEMLSTSWGQLRSSYKGRRPPTIQYMLRFPRHTFSDFQISKIQISHFYMLRSSYNERRPPTMQYMLRFPRHICVLTMITGKKQLIKSKLKVNTSPKKGTKVDPSSRKTERQCGN